jgi:DNA-binding CsgD family transcriptional regulator
VLGRLRARRGDAGIWSALDEALRVAVDSGFLQHLAPVRAARAEAAWLEGDLPRCRAEASAAYALAQAQRHTGFLNELGYWRGRAGDPVGPPGDITTPFGLQAAGRWREAAAAWQERACPYEQAQALAQADLQAEPEAAREALAIFERLGARPAVEALRQRLHEAGIRGLARGPRASTREQPFGLTARELQVLHLLCDGLRNAEIAARLHRSVRTVDHHLAAVFAKLGVDSRVAAIQAAQRVGLGAQSGQSGQPPAAK